ncbi:beta-ketoacyl synthase N-terminal-like domain-containing protein [Plantactinospora sp. WMMC1484]|uniref:beta-ketoacyl synthase N-terminal-like domain-containing protein n=1 Tax=Plantactinospora sp. WMMC1484 TaxID=3404122 RepID=UPI003BF4FED5
MTVRMLITGTGELSVTERHAVGDDFPTPLAPVLADFDVRAHLGRKGTSFYDRATALAVVACQQALRTGAVEVSDDNRARIGVVLGTTVGSFRSTSDFSRETLVQEKPYLVNPVLFPNTVMNCAAGQAAIRFGLRGVNATIAGGRLAFHHALRHAGMSLRRQAADIVLVGAVEEHSPHRAWAAERSSGGTAVAGEAAGVFVVERAEGPRRSGGRVLTEVTGLATGFDGLGDGLGDGLASCVARAVRDQRVTLHLATGGETVDLPERPVRLDIGDRYGECDAASGALAMAEAVRRIEADAAENVLITAWTPEGGVAAALVRGPR